MKTVKELVKKKSKEIVAKMVAHDEDGWPPICTSFIYQPERPRVCPKNEDMPTDKNCVSLP